MCAVSRSRHSPPEGPVQSSTEPDLKNVPQRRSGLSASLMTGYICFPSTVFHSPQLKLYPLQFNRVFPTCWTSLPILHQGPKCPSGCRIQGLLNKYDHNLLKKIERVRSLLDENKGRYRTSNQVSKQTYDYVKEKLILDSGQCNLHREMSKCHWRTLSKHGNPLKASLKH